MSDAARTTRETATSGVRGCGPQEDRSTRVVRHAALVVIVYALTFLTNQPDYDLWARLAVGSLVWQTGQVFRHDIFSYLPTKALWIDHEWGTGVVLYASARLLGEYGIFLLKALLLYLTFVLILRTIRMHERKPSAGILYCVFLGYALFPGVASLVRSQMFTYLFFALWLYGLERIRRQGKARRILWLFPCTMLFWVNLHGGFVAGIGLVALYAIGEALNRKDPLPYGFILLSILPVTVINPYGFALWRYVVEASLMPRPFIPEWHPVSLSGPMQIIGGVRVHFLTGFFAFVAMTLAAAIQSLVRRERPDWTRVIVVAALLVLAMRHQRHVVFFVLAVAALLYHRFDGLLDPVRRWVGRSFPGHATRILAVARHAVGYGLPALVFALTLPRLSHHMLVDYRRFPVGALEFIKQNRLTGNLATAFDWGSYALWKLYPQCKILVDGRYEEVYPDHAFAAAMRFSQKGERWWEVLREFPTDVVVLPKQIYRQADLAFLPEWKFVYQDEVSVVLLPRNRLAGPFVSPDFKDAAYAREDWTKPVALGSGSQ